MSLLIPCDMSSRPERPVVDVASDPSTEGLWRLQSGNNAPRYLRVNRRPFNLIPDQTAHADLDSEQRTVRLLAPNRYIREQVSENFPSRIESLLEDFVVTPTIGTFSDSEGDQHPVVAHKSFSLTGVAQGIYVRDFR